MEMSNPLVSTAAKAAWLKQLRPPFPHSQFIIFFLTHLFLEKSHETMLYWRLMGSFFFLPRISCYVEHENHTFGLTHPLWHEVMCIALFSQLFYWFSVAESFANIWFLSSGWLDARICCSLALISSVCDIAYSTFDQLSIWNLTSLCVNLYSRIRSTPQF